MHINIQVELLHTPSHSLVGSVDSHLDYSRLYIDSVLGVEPMDLAGSFIVDFVDTLVSETVDTFGSVAILDWLILLVISVVDFVDTIVVDYAAGFEFPDTYLGTLCYQAGHIENKPPGSCQHWLTS